ncbi:MAG: GNAT family N-acetyltransferase [Candidatus Desulfofervidaceae bacterium]|nr:GNAT family N-acetyltransferase [Candidatus Desulfofervidaceae bacterium]
MITINRRKLIWSIKEIWFSETFRTDASTDILILRQCLEDHSVSPDIVKSEFTTTIIDLRKKEEELWHNLEAKSCRYEIRRGEKFGFQVEINQHYDEFYELLKQQMEIKGYAKPVSRGRYQELLEHGDLWTASLQGDVICGHFHLVDGIYRTRYLWGASRRFSEGYRSSVGAANRWLHWQEIKHYKRRGVALYDLGGVDLNRASPAYGVARFKLSFNGELTTEYHYLVVNNPYLRLAQRLHVWQP